MRQLGDVDTAIRQMRPVRLARYADFEAPFDSESVAWVNPLAVGWGGSVVVVG